MNHRGDISERIEAEAGPQRVRAASLRKENEKLREQLGTVLLCLDRAGRAFDKGELSMAKMWINRAEKRARGETK